MCHIGKRFDEPTYKIGLDQPVHFGCQLIYFDLDVLHIIFLANLKYFPSFVGSLPIIALEDLEEHWSS